MPAIYMHATFSAYSITQFAAHRHDAGKKLNGAEIIYPLFDDLIREQRR